VSHQRDHHTIPEYLLFISVITQLADTVERQAERIPNRMVAQRHPTPDHAKPPEP
jgi:hypothetical protein